MGAQGLTHCYHPGLSDDLVVNVAITLYINQPTKQQWGVTDQRHSKRVQLTPTNGDWNAGWGVTAIPLVPARNY